MQGFFGKVPSHGDFVTRNLPREYLDTWDEWLQQSVAMSKAELADGWLNTYLTSPIWRFALLPGVCGNDGWVGIVVPSVDRVGRYFPLTIASSLDASRSPFAVAAEATDWFEAAETLALRVLDEDHLDADALEQAVAAIDDAKLQVAIKPPDLQGAEWGIQLTGIASDTIATRVAHELVHFQVGAYSLWWTATTEDALTMGMVAPELPAPQCFSRFLQGTWGLQADVVEPLDTGSPGSAPSEDDL